MSDQLEEDVTFLRTDKERSRYRAFCEQVSSALKSFDRAQEWADLIKSLARFQKVMDKFKELPVVPMKLTFSKRLAQCLNPALPGGLHLKALETYEAVLNRIGSERFSRDINLYSIGFFPLFRFASISVKPKILHIIAHYYLPLKQNLVPCLTGLVLALLPGLEEQDSEFYQQVLAVLDQVCDCTDRRFFYLALWKCLLRSSSTRLSALNYFLARCPADCTAEKVGLYLPEKDTLVLQGLVQALKDDRILVPRAALELLSLRFRLDSGIFQEPYLHVLIAAALLVLTRREVSLDRRLYSFLLGTVGKDTGENRQERTVKYFTTYALESTVMAVKDIFIMARHAHEFEEVLLPIRILECLVDRDEIGLYIIERLLENVLQLLQTFREGFVFSHEVVKHVTDFVALIQLDRFWGFLCRLVAQLEGLGLVHTLLDTYPLSSGGADNEAIIATYLPRLLLHTIRTLKDILTRHDLDWLRLALQLTLKVLGKLPLGIEEPASAMNSDCTERRQEASGQAVEQKGIVLECLCEFQERFVGALLDQLSSEQLEECENFAVAMELSSNILIELTEHCVPLLTSSQVEERFSWRDALLKSCESQCSRVACIGTRLFLGLVGLPNGLFAFWGSTKNYRSLAQRLWKMLDSLHVKYHYEVAELFLLMEEQATDVVAGVLAEGMLEGNVAERIEGYKKFSLLWRLTGELQSKVIRPFTTSLFVMLDTLHDEQPDVRLCGQIWLGDSTARVERILDPLLLVLLDLSTLRHNCFYQEIYDTRRVLYVLGVLKLIIQCNYRPFMEQVGNLPVSKDLLALNEVHANSPIMVDSVATSAPSTDFLFIPINNYVDILVATSLRFIQGQVPNTSENEFRTANAVVQSSSAELLQFMLVKIVSPLEAKRTATLIQGPVLGNLAEAVSTSALVLQVHLLHLLRTIVQLDGASIPGTEKMAQSSSSPVASSPMFLQTLLVGLLQPSRKGVRFYWLEFLTSCLPYLGTSLPMVLGPSLECLCGIVGTLQRSQFDFIANEIGMILQTLRSIEQFCLAAMASRSKSEDSEPETKGISGASAIGAVFGFPVLLAGLVKDVIVGFEPPQSTGEEPDVLLSKLPVILTALLDLFNSLEAKDEAGDNMKVRNNYAIQDQIIHAVEPLMRFYPADFMAILLQFWKKDQRDLQGAALLVLKYLEAATEDVVLAAVTVVLSPKYQRRPNAPPQAARLEGAVLDFVKEFCEHKVSVEGLSSAWNHFHILIRQMLLSWTPESMPKLLRAVHIYVQRVVSWDRRKASTNVRRERQELVQRIVDAVMSALGSVVPSSSGVANSTGSGVPGEDFAEAPAALSVSGVSVGEDSGGSGAGSLPIPAVPPPSRYGRAEVSLEVLKSLPTSLLQILDCVLEDKEKLVSMISPVIHALSSFLRSSSPREHIEAALEFFRGLCSYPYTLRAWRRDIWDAFGDADFFDVDQRLLEMWVPVVDHLMVNDRQAFPDLLKSVGRGLASQPALFVSREQELINKARLIKRVAFVLFAGVPDQYVRYLPSVQEKLVEAVKVSSSSVVVYSQVFLCLRVLFLRFSSSNLLSFWPMVLSELISVFSRVSQLESGVVVAASRLLDLMLVLPDTNFGLHEWIFLSSCDWSSAPDTPAFIPLVDRLSSPSNVPPLEIPPIELFPSSTLLPVLSAVKNGGSPKSLIAHLGRNYGCSVYAQRLSGAGPDLDGISRLTLADFCEKSSTFADDR